MSIQTEEKPSGTVREYGRRPYVDQSSDTFVDSMKRVTDFAIYNQQTQAHSELKKPYLHDDYQEMEYWYSPPFTNFAWPDWVWPTFKEPVPNITTDTQWFSPDWVEGEEGGDGLIYCTISCNGNYGGECEDPIECRCQVLSGPGADANTAAWTVTNKGGGAVIGMGSVKFVGGLYPIEIHPPGGSWENVINEGETSKKLQVWFHDVNGAVCSDVVTVYCEYDCCLQDEPPEGIFTFDDDNTPDTIVKNSYIDVYVTGGCLPLSYVVAGTGYTWDGSGTNQCSNWNNRQHRLHCADGTCDVDYGAVASITITDDCGTVVTAVIRNESDGYWASRGPDNECNYPGVADEWTDVPGPSGDRDGWRIEGDKRQKIRIRHSGLKICVDNCSCPLQAGGEWWTGYTFCADYRCNYSGFASQSPCLTGHSPADACSCYWTSGGGGTANCWHITSLKIYTWVC